MTDEEKVRYEKYKEDVKKRRKFEKTEYGTLIKVHSGIFRDIYRKTFPDGYREYRKELSNFAFGLIVGVTILSFIAFIVCRKLGL